MTGLQSAGHEISTTANAASLFGNGTHCRLDCSLGCNFTVANFDRAHRKSRNAISGDVQARRPLRLAYEQVLKETGPLDILVLGNSRMLVAIDHAALREDVKGPDGPLKSETIAARFNGYDLSYTFLKDFFIHRRARLVIINYPDIPQIDSHPGEKYIRTLGQPDPGLDIKTPSLTVTNYAEMALIGPRLALASIIRPGSLTRQGYRTMEDFPDFERTRGSYTPDEGYQEDKNAPRAPFAHYDSPDKPQPAIIISPGAPLPAGVILTDRPLTSIESCLSSGNQSVMRKKWRHPCVYAAANGKQPRTD